MIIKIDESYYKIYDSNKSEIKDVKELKKIVEVMKIIKYTLDVAEGHVYGDDMSHLDTSEETRVEIYEQVLMKSRIYVRILKVSVDEEIAVL